MCVNVKRAPHSRPSIFMHLCTKLQRKQQHHTQIAAQAKSQSPTRQSYYMVWQ